MEPVAPNMESDFMINPSLGRGNGSNQNILIFSR
jgi:hypothetical protein